MIEYRKELFEMELLNIQQIEKYYGNKSVSYTHLRAHET